MNWENEPPKIHPLDLLAESEKPRNFRSFEEAIEHAVKQLAVALVLKDARAECFARLKLIDAYIKGKYVQQAKDHCSLLLSQPQGMQPRWRAEVALREAEISDHPTLSLERLQVYADFFGLDDCWCRVALAISTRLSPSSVRDSLLQQVAKVATETSVLTRALQSLADTADSPDTRRRANEQLLQVQPSADTALKVSLALAEIGNFKAAVATLASFEETDERVKKAVAALKLKI